MNLTERAAKLKFTADWLMHEMEVVSIQAAWAITEKDVEAVEARAADSLKVAAEQVALLKPSMPDGEVERWRQQLRDYQPMPFTCQTPVLNEPSICKPYSTATKN
jgi:hypothetical protein